jgi:hypothetical protein
MNALLKTLVGDVWNLSTVAIILLATGGLVFAGHANAAALVVPPLTLAAVAWLAKR